MYDVGLEDLRDSHPVINEHGQCSSDMNQLTGWTSQRTVDLDTLMFLLKKLLLRINFYHILPILQIKSSIIVSKCKKKCRGD